ncbi:MAG: hypothetical protein A2428_02955 [Bdellovibrionales bacterium RIFOXYC1_FULL_54_43]|nr:MAG: hypothetical protein A2428_02955 [Bdellovibrionales bacterium RIFOXYC1_FULL_54_43]
MSPGTVPVPWGGCMNPCPGCSIKDDELSRLRADNIKMRSVISVIKRAIHEVKIESIDDLGSLNIDQATRLLVLEALDRTGGDRALAAKLLGVARSTLFEFLKRYEIRDRRSRLRELKRAQSVEIEYVKMAPRGGAA